MTLKESCVSLAAAIRRAAREHGRPNSFGCRELAILYGGPTQLVSGRVGKDDYLMGDLFVALGGRARWGSPPMYADGRFYV